MRNPERALPLAARLVLTYALLVGATILVVAAIVLQLTRSHLEEEVDRRLSGAVASFRTGPARRVASPDDIAPAARRWLAVHGFTGDELAAVRTPGGGVLSAAGGIGIEGLERGQELLASGEARWWDLEDRSIRALSVPLELGGEQVGTLVVGASRAQVSRTVGAVLIGIGWAGGVGLALATLFGLLAVRRTLRPLARMSREVEAIQEAGDLSRRLGGVGPPDEVGRLARAFDGMMSRLEQTFGSQRRFLSDASHELRTPLTVIRGQLELLATDLQEAGHRAALEAPMGELDRMRRIVDDLLLLARLDEGLPLASEPVEVELAMQEALVRGLGGEKRAARVEADPGLAVLADPERLQQVLTNLVANAARHAGEEAGLSLSARRAGSRVEIRVADTGRGIPREEQHRIFDRLYRGGAARREPGAGLGLSIVASLVEAMGGEVGVRSTTGEGTAFTVTLPVAALEAVAAPDAAG